MLIPRLKDIKLIHSSALRFLLVGGTTVLLDFVVYIIFLFFEVETDISKSISFSIGAVFSYFANKGYTFNSKRRNASGFMLFAMLYGLTLAINVSVNELMLLALGKAQLFIVFAFLIATSISAAMNYLGMKYIIFKV